jgi:hypothetical protein
LPPLSSSFSVSRVSSISSLFLESELAGAHLRSEIVDLLLRLPFPIGCGPEKTEALEIGFCIRKKVQEDLCRGGFSKRPRG